MGHLLYLAETQEAGKLLRAREQEDERRNSGLVVAAKGPPTLPTQGLPPEEWLLSCVLSLGATGGLGWSKVGCASWRGRDSGSSMTSDGTASSKSGKGLAEQISGHWPKEGPPRHLRPC